MNHHDQEQNEEKFEGESDDAPQEGESAEDRPDSPEEGTSPPGNQEADSERVEQAKEDLGRAGAN